MSLPPCRRALVALVSLFLCAAASAVPLRVATFNIELGLEAQGTVSHDFAADVLARINADVVALQEVRTTDVGTNIDDLANTLGYDHQFIGSSGPLDSTNRNVILSRYPIVSETSITSPSGAVDMARVAPAVVVDVPGTDQDPTIITVHLKCCGDDDDPFRRAVELDRVVDYLVDNALTAADNVIILGDFNLVTSARTYTELPPTGLPGSYMLGSDITFPVEYDPDPAFYFSFLPLLKLQNFQADGVTDTTQGSSATLDHILVSPALANRPYATEIYNSSLEASYPGLPKSGLPLTAGSSNNASDHYAIFGDFLLETPNPLSLTISAPTVAESDPAGAAVLTASLPFAPGPGESVEVTLATSDQTEAIPAQTSVTFTTGVSSLDVDVAPQTDILLDGSQAVVFTASASGYTSADANLTVTDTTEDLHVFTSPSQAIADGFDGFDGVSSPALWLTPGGPWNGLDDGSSVTPGNYAYGSGADPSLGTLLNGAPLTATGAYLNSTGSAITSMEIKYDAEQWRSSQGGNPDTWTAELVINGTPTALPALDFMADTTQPTGPVANGDPTTLSTVVTNLSIPDGEEFEIRFTATPGAGGSGALPEDVFVNEFHYDNDGGDTGEFIEVVVGPGYSGPLADLEVVLYNGNAGTTYDAHTLDTFVLGDTTPTGHRILSKSLPTNGIQNGSPDGFAVVSNGAVLHFISYEGSFTAAEGPADGMTSTDIGVSQGSPVPDPGVESLGLTGTGGDAADFTWIRFPGAYTQGAANDGQTFTTPAGSQGIALDNICVTLLAELDTDGDGDPDLTDADDDNDGLPDTSEASLGTDPLLVDTDGNGTDDGAEDFDGDGQSNFAEVVLFLTDPLDAASLFAASASADPGDPQTFTLHFPTLVGRSYTVQRSHTLLGWTDLSTTPGDGNPAALNVPGDPAEAVNLFRVRVTLP